MKAIIMAAGKGTRMKSDLPKVVHLTHSKPMIIRIIDALNALKYRRKCIDTRA